MSGGRSVHPSAVVAPGAEIGENVQIGPFCVIGPKVRIDRGNRLLHRVTIEGRTTLGEGNTLFPGAVIGTAPQDLKYDGEDSELIIGSHNAIREGATINIGTANGGGVTRVGSHNLIMANSHVAHDCDVGDHVILSNGALLAGHVHVESHVAISGGALVHHYATIGESAFVAGGTRVNFDAPPYMTVHGARQTVSAVNLVGLKRRGFSPDVIDALKEAHRVLWRSDLLRREALARVESKFGAIPQVCKLIAFLRASAGGRNGRALEAARRDVAQDEE